MSHLKEILEKESARDSLQQCAVIHLFREGTFYRAYEWSAWLCVHFFTELKVTHRVLKSGEDFVFVGFPLTSIERFTPVGATVSPAGEKCVEMALPVEVFEPDADNEMLGKGFEDWKRCQPLTEAAKKRVEEDKARVERNAHPHLSDIMMRVLAYDPRPCPVGGI